MDDVNDPLPNNDKLCETNELIMIIDHQYILKLYKEIRERRIYLRVYSYKV